MINIDQHDILIRDSRINELEREMKDMLALLYEVCQVLEYYARQENGYVAKEVLTKIEGGH